VRLGALAALRLLRFGAVVDGPLHRHASIMIPPPSAAIINSRTESVRAVGAMSIENRINGGLVKRRLKRPSPKEMYNLTGKGLIAAFKGHCRCW
jgi:hypothetical protein